jgi:alpha-L-rhamnosidase
MDTYAFYTKFLHDLWLEQKALDGSVPYTVPTQRYTLNGSTAWGEAATVIP